ncbi:MAG: NlpC/P60 family protein [Rhodobacter sp.]|nr:NlpC/P60 family protein [Rhodobacter sp.]
MSGIGAEALAEARAWLGTAYVHQGSAKGAGCDCLGLLRGVWRALYGAEPEAAPAYTPDWSEASRDERLWRAAERHLAVKRIEDAGAGDVLLFRMRGGGVAKHLGIAGAIGASPSFVHAYSGHGVVESPLSAPWRRRIVARFEFPERG